MASNISLGYHQLMEDSRHNRAVESETKRHNVEDEAIRYQDLDQKLNIANADRFSREKIARLDREARASIAEADRLSRESIAASDRSMKEYLTITELLNRTSIANLDRASRITENQKDRDLKAALQDDDQEFKNFQRLESQYYDATGLDRTWGAGDALAAGFGAVKKHLTSGNVSASVNAMKTLTD